jgi:DNA invertase Pin-like site-specific DNA recombinase
MQPVTEHKRFLGYLRVSTDEQADSGAGLAAQQEQLRRAFEYEGWELVEEIRDEGASGKDLDRPGLRRALELINAGEADGLVVAKLDRLTRSVVDFGDLLEWFDLAGAAFVALDLRLDTSTPTGAMVAHVLVVVAESLPEPRGGGRWPPARRRRPVLPRAERRRLPSRCS